MLLIVYINWFIVLNSLTSLMWFLTQNKLTGYQSMGFNKEYNYFLFLATIDTTQ